MHSYYSAISTIWDHQNAKLPSVYLIVKATINTNMSDDK